MAKKHFSPKYRQHVTQRSPSWRFRGWLCFALLLGRDCICPLLPAHHAEHLHYRGLGRELPWLDIVPMNRWTHRLVTWLKDVIPSYRFVNCWLLRLTYGFWIGCEAWVIWQIWQQMSS